MAQQRFLFYLMYLMFGTGVDRFCYFYLYLLKQHYLLMTFFKQNRINSQWVLNIYFIEQLYQNQFHFRLIVMVCTVVHVALGDEISNHRNCI